MAKSLYLINPRSEIPTYFGAEVFEHWGFEPAQANADLATVTVAAMAPADWRVTICDEHIGTVDFDVDADFVGLTGKVTQERRMVELAGEFRRRGKTVIIGGPFASLTPDVVREHCDVLVVGELEGIAEEFFGDLERGSWKREYVAERPELDTSPVPRWDLYDNSRSLVGCVQTSRGCPFECEFCDVIQYLGRKQRHKPIANVLAELDVLYDLGYRAVFLSDDNLTVYRKRAKELLAALRDWNRARTAGPVHFFTQVSIDAARDAELMRLLGESGMTWVFIGIETPNVESLKETKKRQNVGVDLIGQVEVFLEHGIGVMGGMIVGFDHDEVDIFERQFEFAMESPIPFFTLGALVAPPTTPLYDRMEQAGRLTKAQEDYISAPWDTNVMPSRMSSEELFTGLRWLCNQLYTPENFTARMLRMIDRLGPRRGAFAPQAGLAAPRLPRPVEQQAIKLMRKFMRSGPAERRLWTTVYEAMEAKPGSEAIAMLNLFRYAQVRCLYEVGRFYEPHPTELSPFAGQPPAPATERLVTLGA